MRGRFSLEVGLFAGAILAGIPSFAPRVQATCAGDCDGSGTVQVNEVVRMVGIALGQRQVADCVAGDSNGDGGITVEEIVAAVDSLLRGCPPVFTPTAQPPTPSPTPVARCEDYNGERRVFFGDLHVHTANSFDAYTWDVRTTPADSYRFARGTPIALPPLDAAGNGTRSARIDRPLDFTAVTDHSEFLGEVSLCSTPGSPVYDAPTCQSFRRGFAESQLDFGARLSVRRPQRAADVCGTDWQRCIQSAGDVWERIRAAAAQAYEPCRFTTFIAYEYTNALAGSTLHRNVVFANDRVPPPVSVFEQPTPQGLWRELERVCKQEIPGCDVIAIPHNSNESTGRMFTVEYPGAGSVAEQREQALLRARVEPLVEIFQHKGSSECFAGLPSVLGAPDEACDFEPRRRWSLEDCGEGMGQLGAAGRGCISRRDYVRNVLGIGLQEYTRLGVNPVPLGFIGSTDTHNGTPGRVAEYEFQGHRGAAEATPEALMSFDELGDTPVLFNPGGLAAVWAEENTREAIFAALKRKETFATSGPRIVVRAFAGWELPNDWCERADRVRLAYAQGVPMGGTLHAAPTSTAPVFAIAADYDPGTPEHPGTPLQRIQVIKGSLVRGTPVLRIFDVAGDAENGAAVDLQTCTPTGSGFRQLCTVWRDPEFDSASPAFYYVRVLENPSCRWHVHVCNQLPPERRPAACSDPTIPQTIQERAWTSPIWYLPG
ncbi:MAG: hypothetical protein KatS3mg077_0672 [Candidatus Binatia bacterium]|nr:MAG: hypothetical protein KatS3mg077_0672 [Candidatus Binatia bacterium]